MIRWNIFWVIFTPSKFCWNKYGLPSHDLRRFGITALINEGVSPYRIWNVVRHKIPGMSEVTMMYNRPTIEDLIEAMEIIAK